MANATAHHPSVTEIARVSSSGRTIATPHTFWWTLWARMALEGIFVVGAYFATWEVIEQVFLADVSARTIHALHIVRGTGAAFMLGTWSFLRIRAARRECDELMDATMSRLEQCVHERTFELEEAQAFTELLFDSLRERIVVYGADGRIVKANRTASALALESLVGKTRDEAHKVEAPAAAARLWETETITVPDKCGAPAYFIEVGRDVTEPKNLEAQVRHQEKMSSLGMLTAGFAHDLGNPLASLSTELEMLDYEDDVTQMRGSLGVLREHVGRMTRTLREMVDFARRRRDEVADISIAEAVADSARLVQHDPRWRHMNLVVDVSPEIPPVHMVEDHLVLVFVNLMLNAADAMPRGGTLTISARRDDRDGSVDVRVHDTGEGMTPDVLARAKTPLFTTKGQRGTGLGLSVCDNIVRSAGGRLDVSSVRGAGTTVTVHLPAMAALSSAAASSPMHGANGHA